MFHISALLGILEMVLKIGLTLLNYRIEYMSHQLRLSVLEISTVPSLYHTVPLWLSLKELLDVRDPKAITELLKL